MAEAHWTQHIKHPLVTLSAGDSWTIGDSTEGMLIVGANGVGKSNSSGAKFARAMLAAQYGGLVLCAKPDELATWVRHARATGREGDLVVLSPEDRWRFNFLDYELRAATGSDLARNLVALLLTATSAGDSRRSEDPFWDQTLEEMLLHTIDLAIMAIGRVELSELASIIRSAPSSMAEVFDPEWQRRSRCFELLQAADNRREEIGNPTAARVEDLRETAAYWLRSFPELSQKTRSIIVSSFTSKVSGLLRHPLRELFSTRTDEEVTPAATHRGKIVVLNLPLKTYGTVGRFAQLLYKTSWQRATERRELRGDYRPVFLWADEAQYFVTEADALYQQTARSKLAATVYLTQNLPNLHAALGGRPVSPVAESLVACLQTKVFHANGDPRTNEWAESVFGRGEVPRSSLSIPHGGQQNRELSSTIHDSREHLVPAVSFTTLRKAGPESAADTILFQTGRRWRATGKNFLPMAFPLLVG